MEKNVGGRKERERGGIPGRVSLKGYGSYLA